jgi:HEAT repeat protein
MVSEIVIVFMLLWCVSVFLIKKEYLKTLIGLLKKGYFTGASLFLNDESVTDLLLKKTKSGSALEVIHALNLLEKSGYGERHKLLLNFLQNGDSQIKTYVLLRIIANNMTSALPLIKGQLESGESKEITAQLYQALFYLNPGNSDLLLNDISNLSADNKKAAMVGLLLRKQEQTENLVYSEVEKLSKSTNVQERLLALEIILESGSGGFGPTLSNLLNDGEIDVCKKAVEASGNVKNLELFEQVLQTVKNRKLYSVFKSALFYYGDDAFSKEYYKQELLDDLLLSAVIKTASKINGEKSTDLLMNFLKNETKYTDTIVCSLWMKKAVIIPNELKFIEECIAHKLHNSSLKLSYYMGMANDKNLAMLQEAIQKEIKSDLHTLLRMYSFIYDTEKLNRVTELITSGSASHIYNAIEMLELILPAKYFAPTNHLIEWLQDVNDNKAILLKGTKTVASILEEIFLVNKAGLHSWTRSIACYTMLKSKKDQRLINSLQRSSCSKDDRLFKETRNYVLSILNN